MPPGGGTEAGAVAPSYDLLAGQILRGMAAGSRGKGKGKGRRGRKASAAGAAAGSSQLPALFITPRKLRGCTGSDEGQWEHPSHDEAQRLRDDWEGHKGVQLSVRPACRSVV